VGRSHTCRTEDEAFKVGIPPEELKEMHEIGKRYDSFWRRLVAEVKRAIAGTGWKVLLPIEDPLLLLAGKWAKGQWGEDALFVVPLYRKWTTFVFADAVVFADGRVEIHESRCHGEE